MKLKVYHTDGSESEHVFEKSNVLVGRHKDCDLQIIEKGVSRKHAEVFEKADKIIIKDLGSSNGTFINEKKITEYELTTYFPVSIGSTVRLELMESVEVNSVAPISTIATKGKQLTASASPKKKRTKPNWQNKSEKYNSKTFPITAMLGFICIFVFVFIYLQASKKKGLAQNAPKVDFQQSPFEYLKRCSSPIGSCSDLKLKVEKKESLIYSKEEKLYIQRNISFPFRYFTTGYRKLSREEKAKALVLETFLRSPVYRGFLSVPQIKEIIIIVYDYSKGAKEVLRLEVVKNPKFSAPPPPENVKLATRIFRKGQTEAVIRSLKKWFILDFY